MTGNTEDQDVKTLLLLLPSGASLLALAAHFLRRDEWLPVALCLGLIGLLAVRRPWAARVLQGALLAATFEWVRTLVVLAAERRQAGLPWLRMAAILGVVAAIALLSAFAYELPILKRRFGGPKAPGIQHPHQNPS